MRTLNWVSLVKALALMREKGRRGVSLLLVSLIAVWSLVVGEGVWADTLQISFSGTGFGTVTTTLAGLCAAPGCTVNSGTVAGTGVPITLTAVAKPGSHFIGWADGGGGFCTPIPAQLTAAIVINVPVPVANAWNCQATFAKADTLELRFLGNGSGKVIGTKPTTVAEASPIVCLSTPCEKSVAQTVIKNGGGMILTATPNSGSSFRGWNMPGDGNANCRANPITTTAEINITANGDLFLGDLDLPIPIPRAGQDRICVATFELGNRITIDVRNPQGIAGVDIDAIGVTPEGPPILNCDGVANNPICTAYYFTREGEVTLTASPATSVTWSGTGCTPGSTGTGMATVKLTNTATHYICRATYSGTSLIKASVIGSTTAKVNASVVPTPRNTTISNCTSTGGSCEASYGLELNDQRVTLTADPPIGVKWEGNGCIPGQQDTGIAILT